MARLGDLGQMGDLDLLFGFSGFFGGLMDFGHESVYNLFG